MSAVTETLTDIARVAAIIDRKGWADSHSGNISVILNKEQIVHLPGQYFLSEMINLPVPVPVIDGRFIAITGSGTRMRDVAGFPESNVVWLQIAERGQSARIYNYNRIPLSPTSEIYAHLLVFNSLFSDKKISVVHTHIPEVNVLTQHPKFCSEEALTGILWKMQPEGILMFPEGIGFIPYLRTGSVELAWETANYSKKKKAVIWEKHGILAVAENAENALDLLETVSGSFKLFLSCLAAGFEPEGLKKNQIEELLRFPDQKESLL